MHLVKALNVNVDADGVLVKGNSAGSTWDCVAVFDVPDVHRFEVSITAMKDDIYPSKAGSCALGIVEAVPFPTGSVESTTLRQWCQTYGAFLVGTGNFRLYQAACDWQHFGLPGSLTKGHTLGLRFLAGTLEYRLDDGAWHAARGGLDAEHGYRAGYQPCVLMYSPQWPLAVRVGRKRGRCHLAARDQRLWTERTFTDATVVCEGEKFEVHRAVLAAASQVFERAFSGVMKEARSALLEVRESAPAAVEAMLRFVYTGALPEGVAGVCAPLLELAVQYELRELCEEVATEVLKGVRPENVRERAAMLKRHGEHPRVKVAWAQMLDLLQQDRELLAHVVI